MDMVTTLIVVKVSWIYTYVKTYQSIHIKYVPYSVLQLYLSKVGGNGIKRNKEQQKDTVGRIHTNLTIVTLREWKGGQELQLATLHSFLVKIVYKQILLRSLRKRAIHLLPPSLSPALRRPVSCSQMDQVVLPNKDTSWIGAKGFWGQIPIQRQWKMCSLGTGTLLHLISTFQAGAHTGWLPRKIMESLISAQDWALPSNFPSG